MRFDASTEVRRTRLSDDIAATSNRAPDGHYETLALTLGLWLALLIPVIVGSASLSARRAFAVLVIASLSIVTGRAVRLCLRLPTCAGSSAAFDVVVGFSGASLVHWLSTAALDLTAASALTVDAFIAAGISAAAYATNRRRRYATAPRANLGVALDVAVLLAISALVTIWARDALTAVRDAHTSGVLRVWEDFLLQAAEIKYLQSYPAFHGHALFLAGTAQPFYHRASYALSAVYATLAHDPALETSVYFWMPAGIVLLGTGAYGLGCAMGGRLAGVVSTLALFLLPDASMYGLRNGYFAFHWLIQVAPGTGYALALVLVGLALYVLGARNAGLWPVLAGAGLTVCSAFFRVHIAIPAVATFGLLTLLAWRPIRQWHRIAVIAALAVVGAAGVIGCEHMTLAPHFLSGQKDGMRYIEAVHLATPTAYEGVYQRWIASMPPIRQGVVGYTLMLTAELGALLPLLLVFAVTQARTAFGGWRIAIVPWLIIAVHTVIVFLMPTASNGDITEWSHRSFPLVYAVPLIFIASQFVMTVPRPWLDRPRARSFLATGTALFAATLIAVPWHFGKHAQYGSLRDGPTACATPISPDLFKAADFIRDYARPSDKLALSDNDPKAVGVGLTGLQEFVSREKLYRALGGHVAELAAARAAENQRLNSIATYADLEAFGRRESVRWYVLREADMPHWPAALLNHAAFASGEIRVFDLQS